MSWFLLVDAVPPRGATMDSTSYVTPFTTRTTNHTGTIRNHSTLVSESARPHPCSYQETRLTRAMMNG